LRGVNGPGRSGLLLCLFAAFQPENSRTTFTPAPAGSSSLARLRRTRSLLQVRPRFPATYGESLLWRDPHAGLLLPVIVIIPRLYFTCQYTQYTH